MIASFKPSRLQGAVAAPPSKSMAHRYLMGAAISGQKCALTGIDYSEDILATIRCLQALGAKLTVRGDRVETEGFSFADDPVLDCGESGSTLRFLIPLALCSGKAVTFRGSDRLFARPLDVYQELCREKGFLFRKDKNSLTVKGRLEGGEYRLRGDISSQFITGMLLALVFLGEDSAIRILPPFESRPYVEMTLAALRDFGADVAFSDAFTIQIRASRLHGLTQAIEGDYSNAAFLDAFNHLGSKVEIQNLNPDSLQGDKVYASYFARICQGAPTLDISHCPDLGPILFALAALKQGATFTGTDRLKDKESDRGKAMAEELSKLGGGLIFGRNCITIPRQQLRYQEQILDGHNDHRIVMALSVILSQTGGAIQGAQAVKKSYPGFFAEIKALGAQVELL